MNFFWDALADVALLYKDKEALVFGPQTLTYAGLIEKIEACGRQLELDQLEPGSIVGIYLPNGIGFIAAFWAIVRSGHVALTLNTKYKEGELQHYLKHRPVARLVTASADQKRLETLFEDEKLETRVLAFDDAPSIDGQTVLPVASASEATAALMQFSTGSTGLPKGVLRTHGNLLSEASASRKRTGAQADDRIAAIVPLYHAHGFANAMCAALLTGATLVLAGEFEPRATLQLLADQRVTVFPSVPFMVKMLSTIRVPGALDFSALRLCFTAGAALASSDAEKFKERFGVSVYQLYGSTETGAVALSFEPSSTEAMDPQSVGRPLEHATISIFDETGEMLPPGAVGEIGIATDAAATGYDGNSVATQASFRGGYFFPGDVGRLDDRGRLTITGRKSLFINAGGNKIDPAEIESILIRHDGVREVVVLGIPSSLGGEMIKAVIVAERELSREELLTHCSEHLAAFKLPKIIEFREEIPKSPLGKVLRKYLV